MALILRVKSFRDVPPQTPLAQRFEAPGGTLGRGPDNALVLPDPLKAVSRVQARIEPRGDDWFLCDLGSNPSLLNGAALPGGREARLSDGDEVTVGAYVLKVAIEVPGGVPAGGFGWPGGTDGSEAGGDPLLHAAVLGDAPGVGQGLDPALNTLGQPRAGTGVPGRASYTGSGSDHLSPERFAFEPSATPAAPATGTPLLPEFTIFPPASKPVTRSADATEAGTSASLQPAPASPHMPADVTTTVAAQAMPRAAPHVPPTAARPQPAPDVPPAAAMPQPVPTHPAPSASGQSADAMLAALCEGLGLDDMRLASRPGPELAQLAGRMLREAVEGVIGVLRSRTLTKREVRLDTTLLAQRDNNPLKFFPDSTSALDQMLGGRGQGYLAPEAALRGAFDDIRIHELAVMAGMRAALQCLLNRFDPDALAAGEGEGSGLVNRMLSNPKARLWDRYVALHQTLTRDADDDFQKLCGAAFNAAYQQQIDLLRKEPRP